MKKIFLLLFTLFMLVSCKPNIKNEEIQSRYDQVMYVHDEVMPKMRPLMGLKKRLKKHLKEHADNPEISQNISSLISEIEEADDLMMDWMADFKMPDDKPETEQLDYLKSEQKRVEAVRISIETAMSKASSLLNELN